ncbi:MAG: BamA/TamA family outer membrane protein [Sphingomonas sp.]|nr:BamA/TamA family outer membrane protein [Sphingomonas sp.]
MAARRYEYSRYVLAPALLFGAGLAITTGAAAQSPVPPAVPQPPPGADLPEIETIIPVSELESEVPPLPPKQDGQMQEPLESIEEFEKRLSDPLAVEGVAPAVDPEIRQPLPPLEQFDVRPIDYAEPAPDSGSVEIRYAVEVTGLEAVDRLAEPNLTAQFRDLAALHEGGGTAANEAMLRARLSEDAELLRTIMESQGWYSATIDSQLDRPATEGGPVVARLRVAPGERYRIGTINVTAGPTVPPDLVAKNFPVETGEPIVAARIQAAEAALHVALPQYGYPFAEVGARDILLDPDTHLGDYTLPVELGPRARFNGIQTTGDLAFGPDHIRTIARFEPGEIYDSRMVDDLRQALIATGLFTTVAVEPKRTGIPAGEGTEYVTMVVKQNAGPPRTIAASAGYGTGRGFLAQGSWTHNNLFPPEGALIASAIAGTGEQGASLTSRRSNAGKRDRTFQVIAEARRSDYEAFKALTARLGARLSYDSTPIWSKPFTWALGAEILGSVEEAYDFEAGERRERKYLIGGVSGEFGIDRSNSLLNPTRGFRANLLAQPEAALSDSVRPYLRSQFDGSAYYPASDRLVVAGRTRLGTTLVIDRADLAPSRRFYAGGGGSVRGFGYQQLGPRDPEGNPLGGLSVFEAAGEVRYRFGDYGAVAFVDAGQVYNDHVPSFSGLRIGVGVGARYYTNFGPIRVDVATPIDRRSGESLINVYVSIGQAF